ncbi:MAG TPA: nitric oxide synthase oxygenase [Methylomirabilota bacterium]|nr:nitric oxide synthase oxygenase [Methylomirabilota bacterium]
MEIHSDASLARLAAVPLFASLDRLELARLAEEISVVTAEPGEVLLREGALGDRMYVIESGAVQVYATGFDATDVVLARLEPGQWFGEQALLPGGTEHRNASVRALEACRLQVISRHALLEALGQHGELIRQLHEVGNEQRTLRAARLRESLFSTLGVAASAESYRIETFAAGDRVFREGAPGDRVHLVLRGRAQARRGETVLAQLGPGQFFGELAILNDAPRLATVHAVEDLETVSLDGEWFRAALRQTPALRSLMDSVASMYLLPRRGVVTLQTGQVNRRASLTAVYSLPGERRVVTTRLVGRAAFTSQVIGAPATETVRWEDAGRGLLREIGLADGRIVQLDAEGEWTQLGDMLGLLLDGTRVEAWQMTLFRERGAFSAEDPQPLYEDREVICACTHTTCGRIMKAIVEEGCHTLEAVAERTNVTRVCGGCAPLVKELLGKSEWTAARVVEAVPLTGDVRTFRVRPAAGGCREYLPGQHVMLQARIDNRWIQRAYTLSAAPGGSDAYEITVKREPQGVFSRWLFDRLRPDALLRVSEPAGHYYLAPEETRDVVCLVSGIGVTPALAIARTFAARPPQQRLHVDYSVSQPAQVIHRDELLALRTRNPKISVRLRLTRRDGRFGAVDAKDLVREFPDAVFFLCGSEAYMNTVAAHLRECGMSGDRIRIEIFVVAGEKPAGTPLTAEGVRCPVAHGADVPPATPPEEARRLLEQYYGETRAMAAFPARWQHVEQEMSATGGWRKTAEELAFAARLAWRNSTRCVGRLYWEGLALRDFRHVTTGEGMLEAIMGHIEMATNGGSLRPVITVFPPRDRDGRGPRVWSPQLFRYAGYPAADGSVLGDPANIELTEVAMALGWQPPATRSAFDLLPVIVQAAGERPVWGEIPRALVLEIPILHPQLAWFADLGLKWYALPAVSAMELVAGGLRYTAAPFNGWYMGTEIGARNFGDWYRYNLLPVVAAKMGLDTSTDRSLWRDRALVELNVAVLHSYEKAGVTMMDHHAAASAFEKFEAIENEAGRVVHAKWSWIVPPISGCAVSLFHKEHWQDIEVLPTYRPQPDPWKEDTSWRR